MWEGGRWEGGRMGRDCGREEVAKGGVAGKGEGGEEGDGRVRKGTWGSRGRGRERIVCSALCGCSVLTPLGVGTGHGELADLDSHAHATRPAGFFLHRICCDAALLRFPAWSAGPQYPRLLVPLTSAEPPSWPLTGYPVPSPTCAPPQGSSCVPRTTCEGMTSMHRA